MNVPDMEKNSWVVECEDGTRTQITPLFILGYGKPEVEYLVFADDRKTIEGLYRLDALRMEDMGDGEIALHPIEDKTVWQALDMALERFKEDVEKEEEGAQQKSKFQKAYDEVVDLLNGLPAEAVQEIFRKQEGEDGEI